MTDTNDSDTERTYWPAVAGITSVVLGILLITVLAGGAGATTGGLVAQENNTTINNSEYYQNGTRNISQSSWFDGLGDADLDSLGKMATRFQSFFIGSPGNLDQSGTGFKGALITGLVMAAALFGAIATVPVGPVGGSVFAVVIGYGMTAIGLAPEWFKILLLFGVGAIGAVALLRIVEAR